MLRGLALLALVAFAGFAQGTADPSGGEPQACCTEERPVCCGSTCITREQSAVVRCVEPTCCDNGGDGGENPGGGGGEEPCACTKELRPVCGADGETYGNPCLAEKCAGVEIVSQGPCGNGGGGNGGGDAEPSPGCSAEQPICCGARCITLEEAARTSCPVDSDCTGGNAGGGGGGQGPLPGGCACIALYDPVCGEDGVTYGNSCNAGCAKVPVQCDGECPCPDGGVTEEPVPDPTPGGGGSPAPGCSARKPICCGSGCITRELATRALCPAESDCTASGGGDGGGDGDGNGGGNGNGDGNGNGSGNGNGNGNGGGDGGPCVCITLYAPVCGEDGVTYSNEGCAACDDTAIACKGECPCPDGGHGNPGPTDPVPEVGCTEEQPICCGSECIGRETAARRSCPVESDCSGGAGGGGGNGYVCPEIFAPVCGKDGQTYGNKCSADCEDVPVACKGQCPCKGDGGGGNGCICPAIFAPVCGEDGQTYGNKCSADCEDVPVACEGECPCKGDGGGCLCPAIFAPVCGEDGQTYGNKCSADCEDVPVACEGECPCGGGGGPTDPGPGPGGEVCNCDDECNCASLFRPVCGEDGTSYGSRCEAQCAGTEVEGDGACPDDEFEDCCPRGYKCCGSCRDETTPTLVACDPRECGPEECGADLPPLQPPSTPIDPQPSPGCGGPTPVCCGGRCITLEEAARSLCPADSSCEPTGGPPAGPGGGTDGGAAGCCPDGSVCCGRACIPAWLSKSFSGRWCGTARCCAGGGGNNGGGGGGGRYPRYSYRRSRFSRLRRPRYGYHG